MSLGIKYIMKTLLCTVLLLATTLWGQIRVATVTDETTPSSKSVMLALRSKIGSHPKLFTIVDTKDSELSLIVTADCIPQKQKADPVNCFYTSQFAGGTTKTFMGGGIYETATAEEAADDLLAAIAQDAVERWSGMVHANAIENLEACLTLTQSSCKVPDSLVPELKVKIINMSQYFQRGGLKK